MPSGNAYQNAFQNAGQNGTFSYSYNEIGNQEASFFMVIIALILLIALLISEGRNRALMERLSAREQTSNTGQPSKVRLE